MPQDLTDDKSTLVQVMAWCCQATSHYLSQCWPRSVSPYGVTRPQWVNHHSISLKFYIGHGNITAVLCAKFLEIGIYRQMRFTMNFWWNSCITKVPLLINSKVIGVQLGLASIATEFERRAYENVPLKVPLCMSSLKFACYYYEKFCCNVVYLSHFIGGLNAKET